MCGFVKIIVATGLKLDFWEREKILVFRNKNITKVSFYLFFWGIFYN